MMRTRSRHRRSLRLFPLGGAAALALAVQAPAQIVLADYPLLTDLLDATMQQGPITLNGATGPSNGVCVDGVYLLAGGTDVRTPQIGTLDEFDFQLDLEFQVTGLPGTEGPILMGGNGWRWIGFYLRADGALGVHYNNSVREWTTGTVTVGTWHSSILKFEGGNVEMWLDGAIVHQSTIGALTTGNDYCFTTNNFANGTNFNGCIRNFKISNDTTFGQGPGPIGTNFCSTNPNSTGQSSAISAEGSTTVANNDVTLTASDLPNFSFGFFITSQVQGFTANPSGSAGNLCLAGTIGRYVGPGQIQASGNNGEFSLSLDLTQTPTPNGLVAVMAGETWNFQAWHRDSSPSGPTSNFTDGLEIPFL